MLDRPQQGVAPVESVRTGPAGSPTVMVVGAHGFLGARICEALEARGLTVRRGARPEVDLEKSATPESWRELLRGVDAVVNAAGIIREAPGASFEGVHARGPKALFAACAEQGVRVVQISALGADEAAATEFHRSKREADEALLAHDVPSLVLQPSLVFGAEGASARSFALLASLPWIPLPGRGTQEIQPVHVDDVVEAVVRAVTEDLYPRRRVAAVGPAATTLREWLQRLREALGLARAGFVEVPEGLVTLGARLRLGLLDSDTWSMLRRGNTADVAAFRELLGREPRDALRMPAGEAAALRREAQLGWLLALLRVSVALVWIATGVVSAFLYPVEDSLALLARVGLTGMLATLALYGAAAMDFAIGIAILAARRRRLLWLIQLAVIAGYTALITVFLPEQWLHPFGPILKNLPLLAAILLLHQMEDR
jgi:uncharacterized protein YbjT (DUF2867 family)